MIRHEHYDEDLINNNYKIPIDCMVHKLEVHFGCIANFDNSRNLDQKAVDIVDILVDNHFDFHIDYLGIVVEIDKDHLVHCCTDKKIES